MTDNHTALDKTTLESDVVDALKTIYDPEIPVNIYELGLIYGIEINDEADVTIKMTLTTPNCPVAQTFPQTVADKIRQIPMVADVYVEIVWDPPWTAEHMSEAARLTLGFL